MKRSTPLLTGLLAVLALALAPSAAFAAPTFGDPIEYEGLSFPNDSLELADVDRDGYDDAISVGYYDATCPCGQVRITAGGPEGLTDRVQRFNASYLGDLEVGDLNRDGRLDLAVVGTDAVDGRYRSGVVLILSSRDGDYVQRVERLEGPALLRTQDKGAGLDVADFDRDGRADLAVQNPTRIQVLYGSGHGRFSDGPVLRTANPSDEVLGTDLDRDGIQDIVARSAEGIEVFDGRRRGRFGVGATTAVPLGVGGGEMVAGDLERDGDRDLVVPNGNRVTILSNDGSGALTSRALLETGSPATQRPSDVELADLDGNGSRDLLIAQSGSGDTLQFWSGDANGGFVRDSEIPGTDRATGVETTDFNSDGKLDLAVQREDVQQADGPTQLTSLLQLGR